MMVLVVCGVLLSASAVLANCGSCPGDKAAAVQKDACAKDAAVFACTACKTVAADAGKCAKCNTDLVKMRVLACKDGSATLCPCGGDCKCTVNADDTAKCSCGKDVLTVSVKDMAGCGGCKAAKEEKTESK